MKTSPFGYASVRVDQRLLVFLPYYTGLFVRQNPHLARQMSNRVARKALLRSLEAVGHAKRTRGPDGVVRLERAEAYLQHIPQSS